MLSNARYHWWENLFLRLFIVFLGGRSWSLRQKETETKGKAIFFFSHGEGQWLLRGVEVGQGKIPLRLANINACQGLRRK